MMTTLLSEQWSHFVFPISLTQHSAKLRFVSSNRKVVGGKLAYLKSNILHFKVTVNSLDFSEMHILK